MPGFLEIDNKEWAGLEETATHSSAERRHVGAAAHGFSLRISEFIVSFISSCRVLRLWSILQFQYLLHARDPLQLMDMITNYGILLYFQFLRQLMDESGDMSPESAEKEVSVANGIDAMSSSMEKTPAEYDSKKEKQREYEQACREKFPAPETIPEAKSEERNIPDNSQQETKTTKSIPEQAQGTPISESVGKQMEVAPMLSYPRKVTVLYQLLSACLADTPKEIRNLPREERDMMPDIVWL
ncbi:UNVERIFIED_CONTAM: hypothetical protein Slati_4534800 [Sesamum latifolium]|uniref:Uncharacterized protein n=1 Tax=Sesamum latifolium TaxID=2727402 RepID=A0AAW2SGW3_9LAMI